MKAKIIAKCEDGHEMPTRFTTRPRNCGWVCNGCRAHHGPTPGFEFYTCTVCDKDYCNNCFALVETIIKPDTAFGEDPNVIKEKQIVYSKSNNCYAQVKEFNADTHIYTVRLMDPTESKTEKIVKSNHDDLSKFILINVKGINPSNE